MLRRFFTYGNLALAGSLWTSLALGDVPARAPRDISRAIEPVRLTIEDHWRRAAGVLAAAIAGVQRVKTLQAAAARQIDSADYALTQLIHDLRAAMPLPADVSALRADPRRGRAHGARSASVRRWRPKASQGCWAATRSGRRRRSCVAWKLVGASSITAEPNFCTSSTARPRSLNAVGAEADDAVDAGEAVGDASCWPACSACPGRWSTGRWRRRPRRRRPTRCAAARVPKVRAKRSENERQAIGSELGYQPPTNAASRPIDGKSQALVPSSFTFVVSSPE